MSKPQAPITFKYQPMDPDLKAYWVKKLRSREYEQGMSKLRLENDKFCCLGVLCDIMNPGGWHKPDKSSDFMFKDLYGISHRIVVDDVAILDQEAEAVIMAMNDEGSTFAEIADWIEGNL